MKLSALCICILCILVLPGRFTFPAEQKVHFVISGDLGSVCYAYTGKQSDNISSFESSLARIRSSYNKGIFIDCGNFSHPAIYNETTYNTVPVRSFQQNSYDAVVMREHEILMGSMFIDGWKDVLADSMLSNYKQKDTYILKPSRVIQRDSIGISIISGISSGLVGFDSQPFSPPKSIIDDITNNIRDARKSADLIVLVTDIPDRELDVLLQQVNIPIVIHTDYAGSDSGIISKIGETIVVKRNSKDVFIILECIVDLDSKKIVNHSYKQQKISIKETSIDNYLPWQPNKKEHFPIPDMLQPYVPEIGKTIQDIKTPVTFGVPGNITEMQSEEILIPQVLKANNRVVAYVVENDENVVGRLFFCSYRAGDGGAGFHILCLFSPDGLLSFLTPTIPAMVAGNTFDMNVFYESLQNVKISDWKAPESAPGIAGFYQNLFVRFIRAIDAVNAQFQKQHPL